MTVDKKGSTAGQRAGYAISGCLVPYCIAFVEQLWKVISGIMVKVREYIKNTT